jgi:hypothetical protein
MDYKRLFAGKRPEAHNLMKVFAINLFKCSSSSLDSSQECKLRGGFLVRNNHFGTNLSFLFKVAVDTALTQEINLNLKPARLSPRLRVSPSLRLGTRQTLPL